MDSFTLIPAWVIQDALVVAVAAALHMVKREEHPVSVLLEMVGFVFRCTAACENSHRSRGGTARQVIVMVLIVQTNLHVILVGARDAARFLP